MENYKIEIIEELSRVVTVRASSLQEAVKFVKIQYDKQELILDDRDFKGYNILPYETYENNG